MKIMSLRNGGDFGKQLVLRTRCLPNHHHSFVTQFSYHGDTVYYSLFISYIWYSPQSSKYPLFILCLAVKSMHIKNK